jgi:hypothetical protein
MKQQPQQQPQPQPQPDAQQFRLNVEVPVELEATYANMAVIRHSPSEVVIDFIRQMPDQPRAKVYARVVMTPINAKLLLRALTENLTAFESKFGEIRTPEQGFHEDRPIGFAK